VPTDSIYEATAKVRYVHSQDRGFRGQEQGQANGLRGEFFRGQMVFESDVQLV